MAGKDLGCLEGPFVTIEMLKRGERWGWDEHRVQGGRQALQRLLSAVRELHDSAFITYREWSNGSWFKKHPSLAHLDADLDMPADLMGMGALIQISEECKELTDMTKLHPALEEIYDILSWLCHDLGNLPGNLPPQGKRQNPGKIKASPKSGVRQAWATLGSSVQVSRCHQPGARCQG